MRVDPNIVYDGFRLVNQGINSSVPAHILESTQYAWAKNITFRDYTPKTRPGWIKRELQFLAADGTTDTSLETNFTDYIFQGATVFEKQNEIVASVGGRLFRIDLNSYEVLDITTTSDVNNPQLYRAWFCEADRFLVVQDGQAAPWIYDGGLNRRSDTLGVGGTREVPVGTAMAYSQGRMVVALPEGTSFVIGDIVGGPSGTYGYDFKDALLKFTENDIIGQGGSFTIPTNAGNITAIAPIAVTDTSTGQGPTQLFTTNAAFSINTPSERDTWATVNYPIQTYSLINNGALSDRSTVLVNGDIWMRALDGVRSLMVARRDFGTWVNTPVSREVEAVIGADTPDLLAYGSAALFDNRLLMTARPYPIFEHGVAHEGLVVVDFAPISYLGAQPNPVWEGVWTGLRILQVLSGTVNGEERCFIFALDTGNNITFWEITKGQVNDDNGTNVPVEISWSMETGGYAFNDQGYDLKRLQKGWLWFNQIQGEVTISTFYRANDDPCWHSWHNWSFCANTETCGTGNCLTPLNLKPQYRRPYLLPTPSTVCDTETGIPDALGEEFQVRFEGTGYVSLSRMLLGASVQQQDVNAICPATEGCKSASCCATNEYAYFLE